MYFTSPISFPVGKLLDFILPKDTHTAFRRRELKALVDMHGADEGLGGGLSEDEVQIICGALDLTHKVWLQRERGGVDLTDEVCGEGSCVF